MLGGIGGTGRSKEEGDDGDGSCWPAEASLRGGVEGLLIAVLAIRFCTAVFGTL
jgi:hypothetical protein